VPHSLQRSIYEEEAGLVCAAETLVPRVGPLSAPRRFRDVVIVHELLHLRIQNHGKLFKSLLNSFVPGWEEEIEGRANRICR
jgi:predicted metal-dependent hydrolase